MPKREMNVVARLFPNRIAILSVRDFALPRCLADAGKAIKRVQREAVKEEGGELRGLILDLRDAAGDAMHDGINCSALFVQSADLWSYNDTNRLGVSRSVVRLQADGFEWTGQRGDAPQRRCTWKRKPCLINDMPLVLLVNSKTGGAGQVLAHVLHRNQAAGIWGTPTSGEGVPTGFFTYQPNGKSLAIVSSGSINLLKGEWTPLDGRQPLVIEPAYCKQLTDRNDTELVIRAHSIMSLVISAKPTGASPTATPAGHAASSKRRRA